MSVAQAEELQTGLPVLRKTGTEKVRARGDCRIPSGGGQAKSHQLQRANRHGKCRNCLQGEDAVQNSKSWVRPIPTRRHRVQFEKNLATIMINAAHSDSSENDEDRTG